MSKQQLKIRAEYVDRGFGFPVILKRVPMICVRGEWTPRVNYNVLADQVLDRLSLLDGRLTGNQLKFIRLQFGMTLQQFAARFGVTHPAVLKWERFGNRITGMTWSTEKDIRLAIKLWLKQGAKDVVELYNRLEVAVPSKAGRVELFA